MIGRPLTTPTPARAATSGASSPAGATPGGRGGAGGGGGGGEEWWVMAWGDAAEWQALCGAMGKPERCGRPDFAMPEARRGNAEELDRLIGRWTIAQEARALARRLQRLGLPAGVVH